MFLKKPYQRYTLKSMGRGYMKDHNTNTYQTLLFVFLESGLKYENWTKRYPKHTVYFVYIYRYIKIIIYSNL